MCDDLIEIRLFVELVIQTNKKEAIEGNDLGSIPAKLFCFALALFAKLRLDIRAKNLRFKLKSVSDTARVVQIVRNMLDQATLSKRWLLV